MAGFAVLIAAVIAVLVRFYQYADLIVGGTAITVILVRSLILGPRPFRPGGVHHDVSGDAALFLSVGTDAHGCDAGDSGHCH